MPDGYVVALGFSAAVSLANFDPTIGYEVASADAARKARDKLWELMGWNLRQKLVSGQ